MVKREDQNEKNVRHSSQGMFARLVFAPWQGAPPDSGAGLSQCRTLDAMLPTPHVRDGRDQLPQGPQLPSTATHEHYLTIYYIV